MLVGCQTDTPTRLRDRKGDTKITKGAQRTKARLRRASNPSARVVIIRRAKRALGVLGDLGDLGVES